MVVQYFLIVLFLPSVASNAGLFDLAEYRRVSYDATIGDNFLWFAQDLDLQKVTADNIDDFEKRIVENIPDETLPNYMFVTSKGGQKFACLLPEVEDLKAPKPPRSSKNPKVYGEALAASFYVEKCITLRERSSWWSYLLCRGRTVEQTHGEQGDEGYVKNILGIFDGTFTMPSWQESTEDRLLYLEESYTSGTYCELNKEPRKTTVRYECDSQLSTNEAYISSLVEVVPCQYLMIVKVGTLCHYPEFLPVTLANTKNIGCQPYLTRKDVRDLLERQLEEKKKKEEMKSKVLKARKEYLRATKRYNAMTKSQRNLHLPDVIKKLNAEMDYQAAQFNILVASLELEGEKLTKTKLDSMWKLFSTAEITDIIFYADHDSIEDENRANLWYYFNDPTWPKDQFPKDILATAVQNSYIDEVQQHFKGDYVFDDNGGHVEGLTRFLKTGEIDLETNLVIPAMEIYDQLVVMHLIRYVNKYWWIHRIFTFFNDEREDRYSTETEEMEETVQSIIESIMRPPKQLDYFPMGNLAKHVISPLLDELFEDLIYLSTDGPNSELFDSSSELYKIIYNVLEIVPYPEGQSVKKENDEFKYRVTALQDDRTKTNITISYLRLLAPVYKLLSIQWFQRQVPNYFHVSPPSGNYLKKTETDDYKFHKNLADDMEYFARILMFTTLYGVRDFEKWRDGKKTTTLTAKFIEKSLMKEPMKPSPKMSKIAAHILNKELGPLIMDATKLAWENKIEKYQTAYWAKDHKLRKQAQSVQGLMKDLLAVKDDSDSFMSLGGGNSNSKKQDLLDEKWLDNLAKLESIEEITESLKSRSSTIDDDFLEWDAQEILDLLDKAGLSKKAEIQIKMFDADGREIRNEDMDALTRSLLEENEAMNRFRDSEEAYYKLHPKKSEEKEEEKKASGL
uniref:PRKCSH domain-containing protein n=1 Tax=Caenorhabditis tropicalis TaxID=1561998 RepID=A0A1I7TMR9_9PELO